jgi:cytidylate kinase
VTLSTPLHVAIDGPAASGKTTVARRVASRLGILYLDTGAMYRALAYLALHRGTNVDSGRALALLLANEPILVVLDERAPLGFRIVAGGTECTEAMLQSNDVTAVVSTIAAHEEVRTEMVRAQRAVANSSALVMAGRDIGTVVMPEALVKIFLTASVEARVKRRAAQLEEEPGRSVDVERLAVELAERDRLDRTRAVSPLIPASDAHVIDSSDMTADQVVEEVCAIVARSEREREAR